jgi:hypothetical protein
MGSSCAPLSAKIDPGAPSGHASGASQKLRTRDSLELKNLRVKAALKTFATDYVKKK